MVEEETVDQGGVCCAAATFLMTLVFLRITIAAITYLAGIYRFLNIWSCIFLINRFEQVLIDETSKCNNKKEHIERSLVSQTFSAGRDDDAVSCPICLVAFGKYNTWHVIFL